MTTHDLEHKIQMLQKIGLLCGERDPNRNTLFKGCFMVAEPLEDSSTSTVDAGSGGYAIVGDNLAELVDEAIEHFDLIAGGTSA
ncbi:MAG: hypothetical protein ACRER5_02980 [Pseudomonas sp.]